ncbi:hypothetical protein WJX73_002200 [Symbiochloris irregularis]|uniref:Protein kinase domain-containing protein n=1 Tax=Symbiochloris irregularis TaxID=706552 RepID=A0AAW1NM61_9CHLO
MVTVGYHTSVIACEAEDGSRRVAAKVAQLGTAYNRDPWAAVSQQRPSALFNPSCGDIWASAESAGARTTSAWGPHSPKRDYAKGFMGLSGHYGMQSAATADAACSVALNNPCADWPPLTSGLDGHPHTEQPHCRANGRKTPSTLPSCAERSEPFSKLSVYGNGTCLDEEDGEEDDKSAEAEAGMSVASQETLMDGSPWVPPSQHPSDLSSTSCGGPGAWHSAFASSAGARTINAPSGYQDPSRERVHSAMRSTSHSSARPFAALAKCLEEDVGEKDSESEEAVSSEPQAITLDDFTLEKELGAGAYGEVFRATERCSGLPVALKVISKAMVELNGMQDVISKEIRMHARVALLDHPNILQLYGVFEDEDYFYLVLEFMDGGDLFSARVDYDKAKEVFTEAQAARFVEAIAEALKACHEVQVAHRDVKLENVLLGTNGEVKLADFGAANDIPALTRRYSECGTNHYLAPELVSQEGHDSSVDMWALGVTMFILLAGDMPFGSCTDAKSIVQSNIVAGTRKKLPVQTSHGARDLICQLLSPDPASRPTAQQVLHHEWIINNCGPAAAGTS